MMLLMLTCYVKYQQTLSYHFHLIVLKLTQAIISYQENMLCFFLSKVSDKI
jgi:hypothetical protein